MKLRIKGDSIRLRLTKTEIAELGENGFVEQAIRFVGATKLVYRVEGADDGQKGKELSDLTVEMVDHRITVKIPEGKKHEWVETDLVGLQAIQKTDHGELKILIEKDFACLKPREGEDDSDAYPHPENSSVEGETGAPHE